MPLRRSFSTTEHQGIRRKALLLTMAVVFLLAALKIGYDIQNRTEDIHYIKVRMLNRTSFIVNQDTTNYEKFASTLKREVFRYRKQYSYASIVIALRLPKVEQSKDILDILQIVDAMDVSYDFVAE